MKIINKGGEEMKKEYYKEVIKALKQLRFLRLRLRTLEERLEWRKEALKEVREKGELHDISGISYDSIPISKTYKINSTVEREAIKRHEFIEEVELEIKETTFEISRFERAMDLLNEVEKQVIEYTFIDYKPLPFILEQIGYEERTYRKIKDVALSKLCTSIYGVEYYRLGLPLLEKRSDRNE